MNSCSLRILSFLICLITFPVMGQSYFQNNDTLKIPEVIITRKLISSEQPGFKVYNIDTLKLDKYPLLSLTEVLSENTPLFMKSYGMGGTATSSFRGTSAGHTQLTWNGINISNPMLGQADFSLLPAGMIDNVMISFGGASMDLGQGAIGGIVNMENVPLWKNQTLIELTPGFGSFGRYMGMAKLSTGNNRFRSVSRAYLNSSENDFPYSNPEATPEPLMETRVNNQLLQKGFMQELYMRMSENVLSARFWYQSSDRSLPGSTLFGYSEEKQNDESFRTLLNYDIIRNKNEYFITAAWILSKLNYTSGLYPESDSRNKSNTMVMKTGMTTPIGKFTKLKIVLNNELNIVETNQYADTVTHNNASLTLSAERKKGERFGAVILLRETLNENILLLPDFSAGLEYRLLRGEEHFLKFNLSRNSRIPSFNDRFWNPGGNPDLKNEYAFSFELGYKLEHQVSSALNLNSELNFFNNYIRDMIQWRPGESWFWVADNIGSVNSRGLEYSVSAKYMVNKILLNINAAYSYTRATEKDTETAETLSRQLAYIPLNRANGSVQLDYKNFYTSWMTIISGRSYTKADNSEYLSGYTINNLAGGMKLRLKENSIDLMFKIENIFNVRYQTIEYYPQPGRFYFMTLSFRHKKQA